MFTQKTSAVLSNTMGVREPIYFAGSKIAGVVPWVPAAGTIGMGIDMMSYDGAVTVSLQVDAGLIQTRTRSSPTTSARSRGSANSPAARAKRATAATTAKPT